MEAISAYLDASLRQYTRERTNLTENGILVTVKSLGARSVLIDYLSIYPILSSKHMDYLS